MPNFFRSVGILLLAIHLSVSGCAIHYYDEDTGIEHLWGFGHMKMKAARPNEELQAVLHGTNVLGVSLGKAHEHAYFTLGWQRLEFIDILKENTSIRLEGPSNDFATIRVGSQFPSDLYEPDPEEKEKRP